MIIVTSLSPAHINKDNQTHALESWKGLGKCYSLNTLNEINDIKHQYEGIEFVETNKTVKHLTGRPLVTISAIIDFAITKEDDLLLINSDIVLFNFPEKLKEDGLTVFSRYDYSEEININDCKKFEQGFDCFFMPKQFLKIFPPSIHALGNCWWDYALPMYAIENKVPLYYLLDKHAFHKIHDTQYPYKDWIYIGEYFRLEFKLAWENKLNTEVNIGQVATNALRKIQAYLINDSKDAKIDIFYKSYSKDFKWLYYSLKSITKNVTGYNRVIVLIPENEKELFEQAKIELPERTIIVYVKEYAPGYMFQQWCKISAYKYSNADYILYTDSDVIWDKKINIQSLIVDGKPEILYTDYEQLPDAKIWKDSTEAFIKEPVKYEFMRRFPLMYHRDTLIAISEYEPYLEKVIMGSHRYSEFNTMGCYAFKFEKNKYSFVNTDDWTYVEPANIQLWSHGNKENGADELHLREWIRSLETIMKAFDIKVPL